MEKINMSDSLLFMLSCREALAGIVESSSMATSEKGRTRDFLFNEATDYQIMSLILKGELPQEKYNLTAEYLLHLELKDQVTAAADFVSEAFGDEILTSMLFEIGPLYPKYSSQVPVVEFLTTSKAQVVLEGPLKDAAKWLGGLADKTANLKQKALSLPGAQSGDYGDVLARAAKSKLVQFKGDMAKAWDALKGDFEAGKFQSKLTRLNKGRGSQYRAPEGIWNKVRVWAQHKSLDAKSAVNNAIKKAQDYASQNPDQAKAGAIIAGAALAALAIFGAYKTYKRFFSKAAKACKGTGAERKTCLKQYKVKAIQAQISDLKAATARCSASKDPGKCKATIGAKIQKLQAKAQSAAA